ncbi:hypothetical protein [Tenacibaculum sp. UWU-22]|uniref:DUF6973 domain-containing protein n=1 Tax=Tenacibaculum sp. UWU-22 TaxID=3234187 RepID=UPI0034DADFD1
MKKTFFTFCLLVSFCCFSQTNWQRFKKQSFSTKKWVIFHPFKTKKALIISNEANRVSDSIAKTSLLDGDKNGGQVDAFRHAYWMARLRQEIGKNAAQSLGKAHEKDNYRTFKKKRLEEGTIPDKISSDMDLYNNEQGLKLTVKGSKSPKKGLIFKVINSILGGNMKIIKKDNKKRFLTCDNKIILAKDLQGKWENNKCLIQSNK